MHDGFEGVITRVVAAGYDDALAFGIVHEGRKGVSTGMAHDLNAIRLGGNGLLELIDHLLGIPAGILLDQFDVQRCRGSPGAVGAGQVEASPAVPPICI